MTELNTVQDPAVEVEMVPDAPAGSDPALDPVPPVEEPTSPTPTPEADMTPITVNPLMVPFAVGISGPAGAGKSDTVNAMVAYMTARGVECEVVSFADPLKKHLSIIFDIPLELFYTKEGKASTHPNSCGHTLRSLMQKYGTDFMRNLVDVDFWVRKFQDRVQGDIAGTKIFFVDDLRFEEETEAVRSIGFHVGIIPTYPGYMPILESGHESEVGVSTSMDFTIENNLGTADLESKARLLIDAIWQTENAKRPTAK